jgi:hypothetical protein
MLLGDQGEEGVDLVHGVLLSMWGWCDAMNALFDGEAKRFLPGLMIYFCAS